MNNTKLMELFNDNFNEITEIKKEYELINLAYINANLKKTDLKELKKMLKNARQTVIWYYHNFANKLFEKRKRPTKPATIFVLQKNCEKILNNRANQYSDDNDRLHNFKVGAKLLQIKSYQFALILMAKQWISLMDFEAGKEYSYDLLLEKTVDCLNYLTLIEACFIDDKKGK